MPHDRACVTKVARWLAALGLLVGAGGCGFGSAGIAAALSTKKGAGSGNAPSTPAGLSVLNPKVSPSTIRLVLTDVEADSATVEFSYVMPGQNAEVLLTKLAQNPATLSTSKEGLQHLLAWDFASEPGIGTAHYVAGVTLIARTMGGARQSAVLGLGNDPPVIAVSSPSGVIRGIVALPFVVSDSSGDLASVKVEFLDESGGSALWRTARPGGLSPAAPTPEFGFVGVEAAVNGAPMVFFWDTDYDMTAVERNVRVRFTARDDVAIGESMETVGFRVDNNKEPIIHLGEGFIATPDDRRGIAIPYRVIDDEGDPVRVLFQWRRQGELSFPSLGTTDPIALAELVKDPSFVHEKHICTPFRAYARGHAMRVDASHVRLPEVQQGESRLLANGGMEFRSLELLRPTAVARLASSWSQNRLSRPTAALPLGDGINALVLDGVGNTSRLLGVDLGTGAERTIGGGLAGLPTALAVDSAQKRALVATDVGGSWQLFGVSLENGAPTALIGGGAGGATAPVGPLRGILPLGDKAALATAENGLWRLDWSGTGAIVRMHVNLATPWGLTRDPLRPGRVLVAERDANRILSIDMNTRAVEPVQASRTGGPAFVQPTSIATDSSGSVTRLVVLCDAATPTQRQLFGVNLGSQDHTVFSLGLVPADAATVTTGPADLLLVALPMSVDLAAGGGIEQRREVVAFDPATATATVAAGFAPAVRELEHWQIAVGRSIFDPIRGTRIGTRGVFLWDSRDAGIQEGVFLKATPMDTGVGSSTETSVQRTIQNVEQMGVAAGGDPQAVVAADLDGDGDLDLVCANAGMLMVFFQDGSRRFAPAPPLAAGVSLSSVAAADLDGDGDLDLVCADLIGNNLRVFFQDAPGTFVAGPTLATGAGPSSVVAADLDGDGDLDLVCANSSDNTLTVFFQDGPRMFTAAPPLVAGDYPASVAIADLDGDGDIVCANYFSNTLTVFFQDAPRTLTAGPPLATGNSPVSVAAADLDGDGHLDLVCANSNSRSLTVFFQDAPRTFTVAQPLATGGLPVSVTVADLDGDGGLDLVCANWGTNTLTVFFQSAPRTFTAAPPLAAGSIPSSVAAADLDGDGDLDLVCANADSNNLTVFFQEAPRVFTAAPPLATGFGPASVAAVDLDGDGDLDLLCANHSGSSVTVFFGRSR